MDKKMRVFIVEDEALVLLGYKSMLESANYEIVGEAFDGAEALKQIIKLHDIIDIILLDINIPSMDGISIAEQINEQFAIPCVIITGYRDQALIERAKNARVFGYLQKPVDKYDLISTINIAKSRFDEYKAILEEAGNAKRALQERKLIERAKGILMDLQNMKEAEAMSFMQTKSRNKNKKLVEVAKEIILANDLLDL